MRQPDRSEAALDQEREADVTRLGPPGWDEFSAARERFMRTVAVAGLETAWAAPARERDGGEERSS